jgi:hypothetical protein
VTEAKRDGDRRRFRQAVEEPQADRELAEHHHHS